MPRVGTVSTSYMWALVCNFVDVDRWWIILRVVLLRYAGNFPCCALQGSCSTSASTIDELSSHAIWGNTLKDYFKSTLVDKWIITIRYSMRKTIIAIGNSAHLMEKIQPALINTMRILMFVSDIQYFYSIVCETNELYFLVNHLNYLGFDFTTNWLSC